MAKLKSEHSHWLTGEATLLKNIANLEGSNMKETIDLVNKAEESERTRRMSIPFSCDVEETDLDISLTSGQLSNVHQELLHLFAIHDVSCLSWTLSTLRNHDRDGNRTSQNNIGLSSQLMDLHVIFL